MYGIIYVIMNTVNGKQYVGQTTYTLKERWGWPLKPGREESSCLIDRAIRKYGAKSFTIEQIDTAESRSELNEKEIYHIARLGTHGGGYNLTDGGEGQTGYIHTEETRKKISRNRTGKGLGSPSDETRRKVSEGVRGYKHTSEARAKISEAGLGRHHDEYACYKISEAVRNRPKILFCKRGHPFDENNTYVNATSGGRVCRTCYYLVLGRKVPERLQC